MTLLLDAGALIAYERRSRTVRALVEEAQRRDERVCTSTAVVAQVWRGGPRQARLTLLLRGVDEVPLTSARARPIGALLAMSGTADVVDASVVDIANDGDEVLTSDPQDIGSLAEAAGKTLIVTLVS